MPLFSVWVRRELLILPWDALPPDYPTSDNQRHESDIADDHPVHLVFVAKQKTNSNQRKESARNEGPQQFKLIAAIASTFGRRQRLRRRGKRRLRHTNTGSYQFHRLQRKRRAKVLRVFQR